MVYFSGDYITTIVRYPHSRDYRLALKVYEEDERIEMVLWAVWLRATFIQNYDYVVKNWEKIVEPRGSQSNRESMY